MLDIPLMLLVLPSIQRVSLLFRTAYLSTFLSPLEADQPFYLCLVLKLIRYSTTVMDFIYAVFALSNRYMKRGVPENLVPQFGVTPGCTPDGTGNCDGIDSPNCTPL